jgi:hypothetical protein
MALNNIGLALQEPVITGCLGVRKMLKASGDGVCR